MPQFYLLSVLANAFTGLLLSADYLGRKVPFFAEWRKLLENRTAKITLGIVAAAVGVLKLIVRSPGEGVAVVGDLLPAVAGILLGAVLLGESFRGHVGKAGEKVDQVARAVIGYRVPIGIAAMVVAGLHFLFPQVLFL
jgi:hypothetical protein